jgi:branched-chain amino acid transport system substrate-binding protein
MNKRNLLIITALVIVVAAAFFIFKKAPITDGPGQKTPLTVSLNMPLTGPIALAGKSFQEAALMAIDDLKQDAGAKPFTFDWNDNTGTPATAATIANRQASSNASIYFVGYGPSVLAVRPVLAASGKPIFAFSFQASMTKDPLIYRNLISYKIEYPLYVEYAKRRQAKKIAVIFMDQPEAHEQFKQLFIPEMVRNGWKEADFALFPYALSETDFRTIAAKVAQFSPDLIIMNGYQSTVAPIVLALQSAKLVRDGNVMGTFDLIDVARLTGNEAVEGMAVASPTYLVSPSPKAADFQRRFQERYGRPPSYNDFSGYDFALIVSDVAKRLPDNPTPQQIADVLQKTDIEGVSGRITFDADGDASPPVETAVLRSGRLVPLK